MRIWLFLGGLNGLLAVAAGAYGWHLFFFLQDPPPPNISPSPLAGSVRCVKETGGDSSRAAD